MAMKETIRRLLEFNPLTKRLYRSLGWLRGTIHWFAQLGVPILRFKRRRKRPVFLVFTPQHANLGDHAIALAEQRMLDRLGIDFFEVTGEELRILEHHGLLRLLDGSLILVNGGGNLGSLWPEIERLNRQLILRNSKARIMVLPNSIYYDNEGDFEVSRKIYNEHPDLRFYARERLSYESMRLAYRDVKLIPDMVLTMDESRRGQKRQGCLICLRQDVEGTLCEADREAVRASAERLFPGHVELTDMVEAQYVPVSKRDNAVAKKLDQFAAAKLVITDRLHGMIFCAITGTCCVVLDSKSPKLRGCYEWIRHLDYIRFADNAAQLECIIQQLPDKPNRYDNSPFLFRFLELERDILEAAKV